PSLPLLRQDNPAHSKRNAFPGPQMGCHRTATLTYGEHSADNRAVQGVPRQGAERPPGARQPFEPDPGRAGVGKGTPRRTPPFLRAESPGVNVQLAQRRSMMPDSAPLSSAKLTPRIEELRVTTGPFPSSRKVQTPGRLHPEVSVAMREIDLEAASGEPPVRVYDTSGLYSDP